MKQRPTLLLLPLLTLTLIAGLLINPSSVQAASTSSGPTTSNLIYHGGPVMAGEMQAYAIFWEPGGSFVSKTYNKLLKRYLKDVGDSRALSQQRAVH